MASILVAGESWTTTSLHSKGFDTFTTTTYAEGVGAFRDAVTGRGHEVTYLPNHVASEQFPMSAEELSGYDVVVLSDIGANTLLLPGLTFLQGRPSANRLAVLREWVGRGGALAMVGGYLSFQGIEAKANYRNTALAEVLPVLMEEGDDREESPEGVGPVRTGVEHPVVDSLENRWPDLLGYQRVQARLGADVLATVHGRPLLVTGDYGAGRVLAFTSEIGPHWAPEQFTTWPGFTDLWDQAMTWLATGNCDLVRPER